MVGSDKDDEGLLLPYVEVKLIEDDKLTLTRGITVVVYGHVWDGDGDRCVSDVDTVSEHSVRFQTATTPVVLVSFLYDNNIASAAAGEIACATNGNNE